MEKILTIVIPTYNMERYLDQCLTSLIIPNGMDNLEVLVVNDGSKDSSLQIARKYEQAYPKTFIVLDKENGNYGSCINAGLKHASGKYFKVLDADDSFLTVHLSDFIRFLSHLDVDLIMSDFLILHQEDGTREMITYSLPVGITFSFDYFASKNVPYMWMHAVTHRTDKLRRIEYHQQEGISYTDKEFVFYPMAASETVAYFPKTVYQYLVGREGQTVDKAVWVKNYWMEVKAVKKLLMLYTQHKNDVSQGGKLFMMQQAELYISSIYRQHLQEARRLLPIQSLIEFDEWLEAEDSELYHCADSLREVADFPYVAIWRQYKTCMKKYLIHRFFHRIRYYLTHRHH